MVGKLFGRGKPESVESVPVASTAPAKTPTLPPPQPPMPAEQNQPEDLSAQNWTACDTCREKRPFLYVDPIPTVEVNPQNPQEQVRYEKALCGPCYSKRFALRYPNQTVRIPD